MKHGEQKILASQIGISAPYLCMILKGRVKVRRWDTAKKLAAGTGTDPQLWLEGTPDQIRSALGADDV